MSLLIDLWNRLRQPVAGPETVALYSAVIAQARLPFFYETLGVPDTVDGRYDLLLLHTILVMRRLRGHENAKQKLFDLMFRDMDRSLREMGVGDMSIGKKIKPMLAAFYGRGKSYDIALGTGAEDDLAIALRRNLYAGAAVSDTQLELLQAYVHAIVAALDAQNDTAIATGQVHFPAPPPQQTNFTDQAA